MVNRKISGLLAMTALVAPATVFAQDAASPQDSTQAEPANNGLEIVVTAQRREERLKDVPISITALSGTELDTAGISSTRALTAVTPGLNFTASGAYAQPTIRGVGTTVTGAGADANVAIYVDGVYQPSQASNAFEFNNIERIEVLKGPQGTLFGRNATGGAINVITKTPSFNFNGDLEVGYGNYNARSVNAYITGGLTDRVAADLSVLYKADDGHVRNLFLNKRTGKVDVFGLRAKILWQATDDLSFTLTGNYSRNSDNIAYLTKPIDGNLALLSNSSVYIPSDPRQINTDTDPIIRSKNRSASLVSKYDMDVGTLTSTTSYSDIDVTLLVDSDVTNLASSSNLTYLPQKTFIQEVNYTSKLDGPFNFTLGLFYYDDNAFRRSINLRGADGPVTQDFNIRVKTQSAAAYGEINYNLTGSTRLIAGLRYSSEYKQADGIFTVGTGGKLTSHVHWSALTPRLSLVQKLDERSNIYATYSRGYKSGTYNSTTFAQTTPVNPEYINAYEIGYKYGAPNLVINTSAYYYDYTDIQVASLVKVNGVSTSFVQNAASATIYGFDGDLTARLDNNWRVRLGAAYTHGEYDEWTNALVTAPLPSGRGNSQAETDVSGEPMIRTPKWQTNGTLTYSTPVPFGSVEASATVSYNSGYFIVVGNNFEQNAYTLLNANLSWRSRDEKWRVTLWGDNLTSAKYYVYANATTAGTTGALARPRTYGITLARSFN